MLLEHQPTVAVGVVSDECAGAYTVSIAGSEIPVYACRVSAQPFNQVWAGYQRPQEQTEIAAFASWDMTQPVDVHIKADRRVCDVRVRPSAAGIAAIVQGDTILLRIDKPGQYTVEVNGMHQALHLFADPPETDLPDRYDPHVRYFGPGVHNPGLMRLTSGETLYLASGSVIHGAVIAEHVGEVRIRGRGILDGSRFDRMDLTGLVCLYDCTGVTIDGITLRDAGGFSVAPISCSDVRVRNVKVIGNWRYNSDGIDFISCSHCSVEDSFVRTFDDCICVKGYKNFGPFIYHIQLGDGGWDGSFSMDGRSPPEPFRYLQETFGVYDCPSGVIEDIRVHGCVLWNDWGRALEIGAEMAADEITDIHFEDCDIIHACEVAMDVQNCDRALCRNVSFTNIRVELDDDATAPAMQSSPNQTYAPTAEHHTPKLIVLEVKKGYVSFDSDRGWIKNVAFQNIAATSNSAPYSYLAGSDADHLVEDIVIDGVTINGRATTTAADLGLSCNGFARGISISTLSARDGYKT